MNLNDLLKVNSVRCIKTEVHEDLVDGEIYKVEGFNDETIKIVDRNGFSSWHNKNLFEPVINNDMSKSDSEIDISLNSVDDVNTKFKVGNKVYKYGETDVKTVLEVFEDGYMRISNYPHRVNHKVLCHATPENHAVLSKPFPAIEFEQPPTQADIDNEAVDKLAQAMKNKLAKKREQGYHGWETCKHGDLVQLLINHVDKGDPIDVANFCAFLFARGEQLTQGGTR